MKYIHLTLSMFLAIIGQYLLKKGVLASELNPNIYSILRTLFSPYVFAGFVFYGISSVFWLFVLQKFPLSVAYPALSLTYIIIILISYFVLQEPLTLNKILGILLIVSGVYFLFK